jgi:hypothetical protein
MDRMEFDAQECIQSVKMIFEGVAPVKLYSLNQSLVPALKKSIETAGFAGKVRAVE